MEAPVAVKALITEWIFRFDTPLRITRDHGRQFESHLFKKLNTLLGTQYFRTTTCHSSANGLVERFHRQLKEAIRCHATERWVEILFIIFLGVRAAWRDDLQASTAELIYGESIRISGEFLVSVAESEYKESASNFVQTLRRFFQQLRPVLKHGKKTFIHVIKEKNFTVSIDGLKPAYISAEDTTCDDQQQPRNFVNEESSLLEPKEVTTTKKFW